MGKICDFQPISHCISVTVRDNLGPRLLLIANRKLYTGCRLAPNSMTLNDLERQNRGFYGFFGDFRLQHRFQERIVPKSIEMYM